MSEEKTTTINDLPIDLLFEGIFLRVLKEEHDFYRCEYCGKLFEKSFCAEQAIILRSVCTTWRRAYRKPLVLQYFGTQFGFCTDPVSHFWEIHHVKAELVGNQSTALYRHLATPFPLQ